MKYLAVVAFACVAFNACYADVDVKAELDKVHHAFQEMGKVVAQNINTEEVKETMVKKYEELKSQMSHVNEDIEKYIKDHPDSPVSQVAAKMKAVIDDFAAKNPEVEANLKNFQHSAAEAGEKFTQQMKEAYEKMNADGGLKDQVTKFFTDVSEQMKHTATDIETKLKEMMAANH